jgi:hypothetical protein
LGDNIKPNNLPIKNSEVKLKNIQPDVGTGFNAQAIANHIEISSPMWSACHWFFNKKKIG